MEPLNEIFNRYDTDKNQRFHNYSRQYNDLLNKYREESVSFLEIGVYQGESLKIWHEVFPNSTKIVGLDVDPSCRQFEKQSKRTYVEIGDATEKDFIDYVNEKHGPFDLVLDDGSHKNVDVINAFELIFPLLNDNGLYIVEDTICYKSPNPYYVNHRYPNHLEYFARFIPFLNQWRYDSEEGVKDHCVDPFKILKKTDNVFEYSIDKLEFGCSYIGIHKKIRRHWIA